MPDSYREVARRAENDGVVRRSTVDKDEVQTRIRNYVFLADPNDAGAKRLVDEVTDDVMDRFVNDADGDRFAKRENLTIWEDRWGNVMAQRDTDGERRKLVDKEENQ